MFFYVFPRCFPCSLCFQSNPLISAIWGVAYWHEYKVAATQTRSMLGSMAVCYILAIVLVVISVRS
jgi:hypothetical protein